MRDVKLDNLFFETRYHLRIWWNEGLYVFKVAPQLFYVRVYFLRVGRRATGNDETGERPINPSSLNIYKNRENS